MEKLRVGIIGPGNIAHTMAKTLQEMDSAELYAVASRDASRAAAFAKTYGNPKAYGSYGDMLADPDVELVYIATPHSHHAEQIVQCLQAGKHVLCEKSFTANAKQAREAVALAKQKRLLLAEAIWPRYMPMVKVITELCASGRIGEITTLSANLGFSLWHLIRIRAPMLGGGALLDVGIYPLTFASIVFGDDVEKLDATAVMSPEGVDMQNTITLTYRDGRVATLFSTVLAATDCRGHIYGDNGYIVVDNICNFEAVSIFDKKHNLIEKINRPQQITGFEYEVQAAVDAVRSGACECPQMPHEEIIGMVERMDAIRNIWGMRFPFE